MHDMRFVRQEQLISAEAAGLVACCLSLTNIMSRNPGVRILNLLEIIGLILNYNINNIKLIMLYIV